MSRSSTEIFYEIACLKFLTLEVSNLLVYLCLYEKEGAIYFKILGHRDLTTSCLDILYFACFLFMV